MSSKIKDALANRSKPRSTHREAGRIRRAASLFSLAFLAFTAVPYVLMLATETAFAHGQHIDARAELRSVDPAVSGIEITSQGAQLVLNAPGKSVVIVGENGDEMLRIDAAGKAEANVNSASYYTLVLAYPQEKVPDTAFKGAADDWKQVPSEGQLIWFDGRVDLANFITTADEGTDVGDWTLPLRIDGVDVSASGDLIATGYDPALLATPDASSSGVNPLVLAGIGGLAVTAAFMFVTRRKSPLKGTKGTANPRIK